MTEWQPIDTAPKDGTPIWVCYMPAFKGSYGVVSWGKSKSGEYGWYNQSGLKSFVEPTYFVQIPDFDNQTTS